MALLAAVSIVCAQSTVSDVFAAGAEEVAAQENNAVSIEYLTLQPGERDDSVNLNWYAPEGTQNAIVRMGDKTVEASVRALHTPTKVVEGKYTDTGKIVCQATVSGLSKGTEYSYQCLQAGAEIKCRKADAWLLLCICFSFYGIICCFELTHTEIKYNIR